MATAVRALVGYRRSVGYRNRIYGRVTTHNPYLGYFVHAPSAGNVGSRYFHQSVTEEEDWQRQKALRNRPNSGWFHPRPGSYSRLHSRYSKADTYFIRQPPTEPVQVTRSSAPVISASVSSPNLDVSASTSATTSTLTPATSTASTAPTTSPQSTQLPPRHCTPPSPSLTNATHTRADQMNHVLTAKLQHASAQRLREVEHGKQLKLKLSTSIGDQRKKHSRLSLLHAQSGLAEGFTRERSVSDMTTRKTPTTILQTPPPPPGVHRPRDSSSPNVASAAVTTSPTPLTPLTSLMR